MPGLRIVTDQSAWRDATARLCDAGVMVTIDYVAAATLLETGGRAELALWEEDGEVLAHPYIRRPVPGAAGVDDITSAYEFGGFWSSTRNPATKATLVHGFARAFAAYADDQRIVTEFMRVHPFTDASFAAYDYQVKQVAQHTVVHLDRPHLERFERYPPALRNSIRKAERHGLTIAPAHDFGPFLAIYYANLDRLGAKPYYYFAEAFFERLRPRLALWHVTDAGGRLCAAHVYLRDGDRLFSFLCHGVRDRLDLRPNDFAHDQIIRHSAAAGIKTVHLGGGQPSLLRYKAKFSPDVVPFFVATRVFDPALYQRLVARHEADLGVSVQQSPFFPLYRAPLPNPAAQPERNRANEPDTTDDDDA